MQPPVFRFRSGALDHIARTRHFTTDEQLAAALLVTPAELASLRRGQPVSSRYALWVAEFQGDGGFTEGLFELIQRPVAKDPAAA